MNTKIKTGLGLIIILILVTTIGIFVWQARKKIENPIQPKGQQCTMEAKVCPDGSSVGRTSPNCEFAPCPSVNDISDLVLSEVEGWQIYRNEKYGFEVKYPSDWQVSGEKSIIDDVNKILLEVTMSDDENRHFAVSVDENDPQLFIYDAPHKQQISIDNIETTAYIFPSGYECYDEVSERMHGDCSFFEISIKHKNLWYRITAYGQAQTISPEYNQILSTFKFIDSSVILDKSCKIDSDCEIKRVNCSGCSFDSVCLNKNYESCEFNNVEMGIMCEMPSPPWVTNCKCINSKCTDCRGNDCQS